MSETKILVFRDSDLKKDGKLKIKHNAKFYDEVNFKIYIKTNNLSLSKGYIDLIGFISDGSKFRCYYNNFVVGVTGIIKEIENEMQKVEL